MKHQQVWYLCEKAIIWRVMILGHLLRYFLTSLSYRIPFLWSKAGIMDAGCSDISATSSCSTSWIFSSCMTSINVILQTNLSSRLPIELVQLVTVKIDNYRNIPHALLISNLICSVVHLLSLLCPKKKKKRGIIQRKYIL